MAKTVTRIQAIQVVLLIGALALAGRAGYLQLIRGGDYAKRAARQRTEHKHLEAPRGVIYDRGETPLATSLERYHVTIAPEQVKDKSALLRLFRSDIGGKSERLAAALRYFRTTAIRCQPCCIVRIMPCCVPSAKAGRVS